MDFLRNGRNESILGEIFTVESKAVRDRHPRRGAVVLKGPSGICVSLAQVFRVLKQTSGEYGNPGFSPASHQF
jgi:hypothetical protein